MYMKCAAVIGCSVLTTTLALAATPAAAADQPPLVKLKGSKTALSVSKDSVPSGVVQFQVAKTMPADPNIGEDSLVVISSKDIDAVLARLPEVFDESDPTGQTAAAAMTYIRSHSTLYGGGNKGATWQVKLAKGKYYVMSTNAAGSGNPVKASFKVTGKKGVTSLHETNATVTAAKPNVWKTKGLGHLGSGWLTFRNTSKEVHFMALSGVKPGTTNKQVKDAFADPSAEPDFFTKKSFFFDVISPGVEVAVKGPVKKSRYLLDCFVPSEADGMPHAFMGMWKLVNVD